MEHSRWLMLLVLIPVIQSIVLVAVRRRAAKQETTE
jgi:hypothetical protein